jgi:tetratricopeptide (TPR) repeat protein
MTRFTVFLICCFSFTTLSCVTRTDQDRIEVSEADAYASDGLLKEAAEKYRNIIKKNPKNSWANRNLGLVQLRMKDYRSSIQSLEAVNEKFPNDQDLNFALGEAYRSTEKYPEAIFRYQRVLEFEPRNSRALKGIAWSYYKLRYFPEALANIRLYQPQQGDVDDGQAAIIEARILTRMDRFEDALKLIRQKKQQLDNKANLAFMMSVEGEITALRGDCPSANKIFRDALKRNPLLAGSLFGLGKCLVKNGESELAIDYLERAVRLRPSMIEAYLLLGDAYANKDASRSMTNYRKFRQLAVNDPNWTEQVKSLSARIKNVEKNQESLR